MRPLGRNFGYISILTLVVSFCSIVYELAYSQALTVLYGETVSRYSITIGLYLLSLGLGAFFYNRLLPKTSPVIFWWNELLLSLIGPLGLVFLFLLSSFSLSTDLISRPVALWLSHAPVILVGVLSGFELPLLVGLLDEEEQDKFSKILGLDYVGSFFGTVIYSLVLYPHLGLIATAFWVGFLNFAATFIYTLWKFKGRRLIQWLTLFLLALYGLLMLDSDRMQKGIEELYRTQEIKKIFSERARIKHTEVKNVRITETLTTPYQQVTLYDIVYADGGSDSCLNLDSNVQLCDSWIQSYHEGLVDVPMLFVRSPKARVLVLGGGDWIGIRHLLEYSNVEVIDHVDIDAMFIEFMKDHPHYRRFHKGAHADPKVRTRVDDAFNFLRFNKNKYDLVIIDIPGITHDKLSHLYSVEFYSFIKNSLLEKGLVVIWDYAAWGPFRRHYEVLMNTLREAGFQYHLVYDTFDLKISGPRSSQPFYLLGAEGALDLQSSQKTDLSLQWIEIPSFPGRRSNTVIRPNYDIILH